MNLFGRAIRIFLFVLGVLAGLITVVAAFFARFLINPPRQRLWATPANLGLPFEEVVFPARDGCRLSGWFISARRLAVQQHGTTIILIHGWPWNRLGTTAESVLTELPGTGPVQLLHLAHGLYHAGYNVLMFDLRNHGLSAAARPVTFGLQEANDILGALDYLARREDVDEERIGAVGFSMGANSVLYALPRTNLIRAAIAVQPTSPQIFSRRYAEYLLGILGKLVLPLAELIYRLAGGLRLSAIEPVFAAAGTGDTPILFVQGTGDPWGSVDNVAQMIAACPGSVEPIFVETHGRFGGYQYVIDHPEMVSSFLREHLS